MSLKCGIVGLPNVGKSTLFNALSSAKAQAANFPFCTIEPNTGIISVPDHRLKVLEKLVEPEKIIPTTIEIVDIAGLVKGASKGEGLGNQFLANIRDTDAIIHVLRCFEDENIIHVDGSVDPIRDKEVIDTELQYKDLETVEKRIETLKKSAKSGNKEIVRSLEIMQQLQVHIAKGDNVRSFEFDEKSSELVKDLHLLTIKPVLYVCNVDEASVKSENEWVQKVREEVKNENAEVLVVSAAIEAEIALLDSAEDRSLFLEELNLEEAGVDRLIKSAYKLLNLITYFTAGKKEVKAWTIPNGFLAPQAAGIIHTDFESGFIKAEVIKYEDYVTLGSENACKEVGKLKIEGKEYLVVDGDIMHFRFNN